MIDINTYTPDDVLRDAFELVSSVWRTDQYCDTHIWIKMTNNSITNTHCVDIRIAVPGAPWEGVFHAKDKNFKSVERCRAGYWMMYLNQTAEIKRTERLEEEVKLEAKRRKQFEPIDDKYIFEGLL